MPETLKLAFVGCGAISSFHVMGIRQGAPRIEICAVVDPRRESAEAVGKETGAAVFESFEEALQNAEFDAVDLMLPHHLHEEYATRAFEAGKHVLLEKPMAPDLAACDRIIAAARRAGTVFMVAENAQYWPDVLQARSLIEAGAIGEPISARGCFFTPALSSYYGGSDPWRLKLAEAGGGIALDTGSHWIRPLRMLMGEIDEVVAALGTPFEQMQGESLVRALMRHESGSVSVFDGMLTNAPLGPQPLFCITGSEGEIAIEGIGDVMLYDADHRKGERVGERGGYMSSYPGEFADFEAAVLDGKTPDASAEYALGELRAALAMYRSAETGRWEKVWA